MNTDKTSDYQCCECKAEKFSVSWTKPTLERMKEKQVCFNCLFWLDCLKFANSGTFVIQGVRYQDGGRKDGLRDKWELGHGGREFKIQREDGTVVETNNLWYNGPVPAHFVSRFPDNAQFITIDQTRIQHGQGFYAPPLGRK